MAAKGRAEWHRNGAHRSGKAMSLGRVAYYAAKWISFRTRLSRLLQEDFGGSFGTGGRPGFHRLVFNEREL